MLFSELLTKKMLCSYFLKQVNILSKMLTEYSFSELLSSGNIFCLEFVEIKLRRQECDGITIFFSKILSSILFVFSFIEVQRTIFFSIW